MMNAPSPVTLEDWLIMLQKKEIQQSALTTQRYVYDLTVTWKDDDDDDNKNKKRGGKVSEWHELISHQRICWATSVSLESDVVGTLQTMIRLFEYMWTYPWQSADMWDRSLFDWMTTTACPYSLCCRGVLDTNTVNQLVNTPSATSCHVMYPTGVNAHKKLPIRVYDIHQLWQWYMEERVPSADHTVSSIWNQSA